MKLNQHNEILLAGQRITEEEKATTEMKEEARLAMARTQFAHGERDEAFTQYSALARSSNGEYNGEARCRMAEILMQKGQYDPAEQTIEDIVANASSDYWLAYSFILWADIYYVRGNSMQAKQTLQSILDNYDGEDLLSVARQKYDAIVAAEQPAQPTADEEEITIEL